MNDEFLTGRSAPPPAEFDGHRLQPEAAEAFAQLVHAARAAGFTLRIASAYRSFDRQLSIWNGKLSGERPVLDDADRRVDMEALDDADRLEAVLRFSALPGASRHHWGTDIDVFDQGAIDEDYRLQLNVSEVTTGGVFAPLHDWLDECIERDESFGFYRPYAADLGGVAPERWHLSYAPLAEDYAAALSTDCLRRCWQRAAAEVLLQEKVLADADVYLERFFRRVSPPPRKLALRIAASL